MDQPLSPEQRQQRAFALLQQFCELIETGPAPDAGEWLQRHPECADELRRLFAGLQLAAAGLADERRQAAPQALLEPLRQPDRYELLGVVGRGGMGTVLRARDRRCGRVVAMKYIREQVDDGAPVSPRTLQRFLREARVTSRLGHPGIVPVHDLGVDAEGRPFYTMKLVEGVELAQLFAAYHRQRAVVGHQRASCSIGGRSLGLHDLVAILRRVGEAIAFAHQRGVVHRDLKPANVLVGDYGEVHVMDWGLARLGDEVAATEPAAGEAAAALSLAGSAIGTACYMPPEQARGELLRIGPHSDVYALGAMLYELLCGHAPYAGPGAGSAAAIVERIRQGPPAPPVAADAPPELLAICRRAIEWQPEQRLPTVAALDEQLRRFVDGRVVPVYATGPWQEVRKWMQRNRRLAQVLAAALAALLLGVVGTTWGFATATARAHEFDQLAAVVAHARAVDGERQLWPAWPATIAAMQRWLQQDCDRLLAMRPQLEATLLALRARARPASAAERERERPRQPRFVELQRRQAWLAALQRAAEVRAGRAPLQNPEVPAAQRQLDALELNGLAWERVAPQPDDRPLAGDEPLGLAYALAAVAKAPPATAAQLRDTLAWAYLANGRDAEAQAQSAAALAAAAPAERAEYEGYQRELLAAIAGAPAALAAAQRDCEQLLAEIDRPSAWQFDHGDAAARFLHDELAGLLQQLDGLQRGLRPQVEQRLRWAQALPALTRAHPRARVSWAAARAAIARADGDVASELYRGCELPLADGDVLGLVPIGKNPRTGLWEFYHLRSAWDGVGDPAAIEIPAHRPDGSIEVAAATGIVFVLLPGGRCRLGAQGRDAAAAHFDPGQAEGELVQEVELQPFFLARHELTRSQWQRLAGTTPFWWHEGANYLGSPLPIGPTHPADSIDWSEADLWLRRHGLELPTAAQWEYGCRGGTDTPWWPGREPQALAGVANLHDLSSARHQPQWGEPVPIDDGHTVVAPVGSFRANAFGLYDVHGNLTEWCRDVHLGRAELLRAGDGLRTPGAVGEQRIVRGGSYADTARAARSAIDDHQAANYRNSQLGLRPARALRPRPPDHW